MLVALPSHTNRNYNHSDKQLEYVDLDLNELELSDFQDNEICSSTNLRMNLPVFKNCTINKWTLSRGNKFRSYIQQNCSFVLIDITVQNGLVLETFFVVVAVLELIRFDNSLWSFFLSVRQSKSLDVFKSY